MGLYELVLSSGLPAFGIGTTMVIFQQVKTNSVASKRLNSMRVASIFARNKLDRISYVIRSIPEAIIFFC